jgi:hypothetical protein
LTSDKVALLQQPFIEEIDSNYIDQCKHKSYFSKVTKIVHSNPLSQQPELNTLNEVCNEHHHGLRHE